MKKILTFIISIFLFCSFPLQVFSETIDVLIKGVDDGKKTTKQRDYMEALMNAKLQAIERAGVEIQSITKVENFQLKYDLVESKAKAVLLPGFQVEDMGYQIDGTYQVVLSGKIQVGELSKTKKSKGAYWGKLRSAPVKVNSSNELRKLWKNYDPGKIRNDFEDNKDGTVTDWTTGLMWVKEDFLNLCFNTLNEKIHDELNNKKFAGYYDWRVPTLEELASIVTAKPMTKGEKYTPDPVYFIDPIFAPPNSQLWSLDRTKWGFHGTLFKTSCPYAPAEAGVYVNFYIYDTRECGYNSYHAAYIKGVRSIK